MEVDAQAPPSEHEPHFLMDWKADNSRPPLSITAIGSILIHLLVFGVVTVLPSLPGPGRVPFERELVDVRKAVPLILPPELLTQKTPNKREVSKELDLAGLVAKPETKPAPSTSAIQAPRKFEPPPVPVQAPKPLEIAKVEPLPTLQAPTPLAIGASPQPLAVNLPPPPPPVEKPKMAFETPGAQIGTKAGRGGLVEGPRTSIDDAGKKAMRAGGSVSINESDLQMPGLSPNQGAQNRGSSSLEL